MDLLKITVVYNILAAGLTGLAVYWFCQARTARRLWGGAGLLAVALACAAACCSLDNPLRAARLLAFGCFGYVPAFLFFSAWFVRRRALRWSAVAAIIIIAALAIDMFFVEPFRLEVSYFEIKSTRVDRPFRIALVADFQTDVLTDYQWGTLRQMAEGNPDAIVLAGDYLQSDDQAGWMKLCERLNAFLRELPFEAPLGIFAVGGNVDFERWPEIFDGLPVTTVLETETYETDAFTITGLSMEDSFETRLQIPRTNEKFHVVLGHAPDFALGDVQADLMVTGHTHGGQVRLPLLGPIVTFSAVPRAWAAGLTQIDKERTLVVSRGIGMERRDAPRLRFLCRPQLVFIDVMPDEVSMAGR